jgi:uncharacterized protein involved in exopolysaccharide biosynthesis
VHHFTEAGSTQVENAWSLEDLYRSVARQWRVLVTVLVLFLAASVGVGLFWPDSYQATAVITVEPIASMSSGSGSNSVNMDTETVVATSTEVLALAAKQLPGATLTELRDAVTVSVPKGSQVLSFTYTAGDPDQAAKGANAIATAYSDYRVANAQRVVNETAQKLTARITDLTAQLAALPNNDPSRSALQLQIQSLQQGQASLNSATFNSGSLVSPAAAPSDSTKMSLAVFVAAGLFLGIFAGGFAALISGKLRRNREDSAGDAVLPSSRDAKPVRRFRYMSDATTAPRGKAKV